MEGFDVTFQRGRKRAFDDVPPQHRHCLLGVDYVHVRGLQGGDLYVTRLGWPIAEYLLPDQWFIGQKFSKVGRALAGATGAVYRVPVAHPVARRLALVVKFSRFGQDTNVTVADPKLRADTQFVRQLANAQFLPPFEEFANLVRLRASPGPTIRTKQPLAIYSPPTRYLDWELGRSAHLLNLYTHQLLDGQTTHPGSEHVRYNPERMYIHLYRWIEGLDAVQACEAGLLSNDDMEKLTDVARECLSRKGWIVLDHKPRHVIVRPSAGRKGLVRRNGQIVWALVDYELLLPL
ncbi:MAG: hypothetical protein K8T91_14720 [Planctomycetes bacterium]|nr:hypothetical protein [Planctomycetota bacterium]